MQTSVTNDRSSNIWALYQHSKTASSCETSWTIFIILFLFFSNQTSNKKVLRIRKTEKSAINR